MVEDTLNSKKKGNLEVVLTSFVEGIGDKGDVVTVKQNYGYNKLLLPGLAVYKTSDNLQKFSKSEDEKNVKIHSSPFAQRVIYTFLVKDKFLTLILSTDCKYVKRLHLSCCDE